MAMYNNNNYHKDRSRKLRLAHSFGLPSCTGKPLQYCDITFDDEFVIINVIEPTFGKKPETIYDTYKLPFSRLLAVDILTQQNITEKNKTVIGRGITGGLLFGPAGLFLGGLSGTGVNRKIQTTYFLSFSYENKEGEIKNVLFDTQGLVNPCTRFISDVCDKLPKEELARNDMGDIML